MTNDDDPHDPIKFVDHLGLLKPAPKPETAALFEQIAAFAKEMAKAMGVSQRVQFPRDESSHMRVTHEPSHLHITQLKSRTDKRGSPHKGPFFMHFDGKTMQINEAVLPKPVFDEHHPLWDDFIAFHTGKVEKQDREAYKSRLFIIHYSNIDCTYAWQRVQQIKDDELSKPLGQ